MQLGFRLLCCVSAVAGILPAQSPRGLARLVSHELEISEGCAGKQAAPRKLTLVPGQPVPIPLPLTCDGSTLRFNRLRLTLPLRTEAGAANGAETALDAPMTLAYDMAAEWTAGLPAVVSASIGVVGGAAIPCADTLNANLNAQTSRVCEWTTLPRRDEAFTVNSEFRFAASREVGPVWSIRSTARYAWAPAPAIERIELVQAVQSEDGRVPLLAGKATQLRVFPAGMGDVATRVQVQVRHSAGLWRYTTPRSVIAPARVNRNSDAQSFIIPLPAEVTAAGTIGIDAQLQTAEGRLLTPLARPVTAEFVEPPAIAPLVFLPLCETSADGRERICPDPAPGSAQVLGALAEQTLPVAVLPQTTTGAVMLPGGDGTARRLGRLRLLLDEVWRGGSTSNLAAVLPSRGEWAARLGARWSLAWRMAFASDAANGPEQLAAALHGIYGVAGLGSPGGAGFDVRSGAVVPADRPWISPGAVGTLMTNLRARPAPPAALAGAAEFLTLAGTVSRDGLAGRLGHGFRSSLSIPTAPSDVGAPTCIRLTAAGDESTRYCFAIERLDEGASEDAFAVRIPWLAGARQITLVRDGLELATSTLSATPPQAELLTPQAGNRIPGGPVTVQWQGSDADGDTLRYDLLISTDGGTSWLPVACDLDRTDFTIDSTLYPASSRVYLQLRFSDGMQSGTAAAGPFEFTGKGQLRVPAGFSLPPITAGQTAETLLPVTNGGDGQLAIQSAAIGNAAVQVVGPALPAYVTPGASLPLRLRIAPPSLGAFSATLTLDGARVVLSGRGVNARGPQLETAPASLDFGTVALTQSRDAGFSIGNGGGTALTVTAPRVPPGFQLLGLDGTLTLPPGGQQQLTMRFVPSALGSVFETLALESDDPLRRTGGVALSGHAIELVVVNAPRIEMRPAPYADFGNVRMGVPAQQTFVMRNSGRAPLVVTRISTSLADYSVRNFPALPFTLATNTEQSFVVRLDAAATGARLGQLQVASNDPDNPLLNIGLSAVASLPTTGTVVLQIDDGTFERQAGFPAGDGFFLSRLTPPAYPATLKAIRVYFGERSLGPGDGFGLLWAAHPAGTEDLPASPRMQSKAAYVQNPAEFTEYAVTPMTIESGDFLVGFQAPTSTALPPAPLDISTNLMPTRSYASRDGGTWRQSVLWPGFPSGVFAVRAVVDLGTRTGN